MAGESVCVGGFRTVADVVCFCFLSFAASLGGALGWSVFLFFVSRKSMLSLIPLKNPPFELEGCGGGLLLRPSASARSASIVAVFSSSYPSPAALTRLSSSSNTSRVRLLMARESDIFDLISFFMHACKQLLNFFHAEVMVANF